MNSYQNVSNINPLINNETSQNVKSLTWIELLIMLFFVLYTVFPSNQGVLYIGFGMLFVSLVFNVVFNANGSICITSMCKRLMLFSIYSLMSFLWAIKPALVYRYAVLTILSTFLTVMLVAYFLKIRRIDTIFNTMILIGTVLAVYVIISYGGFSGFYNAAVKEGARLGGDINNVNSIGMECAYSAVIIFGYALFYKKKLFYILFIIPVLVAAASGSRKAMLIVILGVIMLIYFKQQEDKTVARYLKYIIILFLIIVALVYVLNLPIMATFAKRFGQMLNFYSGEGEVDGTTVIRNEMITTGFKQFLYKPFFGIGLRNSEVLNQVKLNVAGYSHNDYVELLVNGGIVGFVLYYSIYVYLFKNLILIMKKDKDPKIYIAFSILVNFLIANWGNVTYYGTMSTYLYLALWIGIVELKKREGII